MSELTARSKTRKAVSAVTATVLALAIMLTGTLAWTSISQTALNETQGGAGTTGGDNPGGRLHDDFDGENKDVYVENFGEVPIYARIRLDEYMEIGSGAGLKPGDAGYGDKETVSLVAGADINDPTTWRTHLPGDDTLMGDSSDPFHDYWDWDFGGSTTYMPTFNKNKDSLEADINGTYDGTDPSDDVHFDDYTEYVVGEQKTADAVYDTDDNTIDEGAAAVEGVNIRTVTETHTAESTLTSTVITMQEWQDMGYPVGPYWVYDVDGWAYWAQPIQPGTATGLLLDSIQLTVEMEEDWYYAINVVAQFATKGDWGSSEGGDGFFGSDAGSPPTEDAEDLLDRISRGTLSVVVTADSSTVAPGGTVQLYAEVYDGDGDLYEDQSVTWSVTGAMESGTTINSAGLLTADADEAVGTVITTRAVSTADENAYDDYRVTIKTAVETWEEAKEAFEEITPGSTDYVTVDGSNWYVLAKEDGQALIWTNEAVVRMIYPETPFSSVYWQTSSVRTWLNSTYLDSLTILGEHVVDTTIYTHLAYRSSLSYGTTTDKIFILTEADFFGTRRDEETNDERDYTYGTSALVREELWPKLSVTVYTGDYGVEDAVSYSINDYWLRSTSSGTSIRNARILFYSRNTGEHEARTISNTQTTRYGVLPAMWIDLST